MEYVDKARDYFKEVVAELKRVTWPTKKDTMAATWVVIITVIILSVFLGIVDLGLSQSIKLIIK
ncbi:MAG: secE [Deltaproteobacteria bacterium]|nr:secE [Deltaproteobacteria bacterium]MBM2838654.1 secE [Deltaproteobacteria bacterium]OGP12856.1 MAG: preprotein translocase subunit SecE [Deltaproteobacteria bacterium GWA2_47_9]